MKITTPLTLLLAFILYTTNLLAASNAISTRIDIVGATNSDCIWFITNPLCTHGFDNGWDAYETNTSSSYVQLYANEVDNNNYQIDAVNDMNNINLYFKSGLDTVYTLTVLHQNFEMAYSALYLYDVVTNKVIDITKSGTTYTFSCTKLTPASKRFTIYTSYPYMLSSGISTDLNMTDLESIKINVSSSYIYLNNETDEDGILELFHVNTGIAVGTYFFSPNGLNMFSSNLLPGLYLAVITTKFNHKVSKIRIF
jgi:hypothetical protein